MPHNAARSVADSGKGIFGQRIAELFNKCVNIGSFSVFLALTRKNNRIMLPPIAAFFRPKIAFKNRSLFFFRCGKHFFNKVLSIGKNRHINVNGRLFKFSRVYIDHYNLCLARPGLPVISDLAYADTGSYTQKNIGVLNGKVSGAVAHIAGAAAIKRMVAFNNIYTVPICYNRNAEL